MRILHDILFPKKRPRIDEKIDVHREYSTEELEKFIKIRDDMDLKIRVAQLSPMQREKLEHMIKERRNARNRKA